MRTKLIGALALATAITGPLAVAGASTYGAGQRTTPVTVHSSKYGKVLFDGKGRSLYLFAKDKGGKSSCYGACAKAWPPLLTSSKALHAGNGARMGLLGTTRRHDGRLQVTYAGHPLYGFANDTKRGQITCQNVSQFGARWLVVSPGGKAVH
jgi:predicted lipoprotein with Yx(FWY)xxD motif